VPVFLFSWSAHEWEAALKGLAVGASFFAAFAAVHLRWAGRRDSAGIVVGLVVAAVVGALLLR
jgi:hypothetical protein